MKPYDESDYDRDCDTVENNGEWGVSYCRDGARDEDVEDAQDRIDAYESGEYDSED